MVKSAVPVDTHFSEIIIATREAWCKILSSAASPCGVRVTGKNASVRRDGFQRVFGPFPVGSGVDSDALHHAWVVL